MVALYYRVLQTYLRAGVYGVSIICPTRQPAFALNHLHEK